MDKLEIKEKLWGGIFGLVAIIAAIGEMFANGINTASIFGMVKDVAGTLVVVVLLVAFVKSLPRKPKNLAEKTERAVEVWGEDNAPFIFKTEGYVKAQNSEYSQGFVLLQNPKSYVSLANNEFKKGSPEWHRYAQYGNGKLTGKFLDMPSYEEMLKADFKVLVVMEQSHFSNMSEIDKIVDDLVSAVNVKHVGGMSAVRIGKSYQIRLSCTQIKAEQDVASFVEALDFILSLIKVVA